MADLRAQALQRPCNVYLPEPLQAYISKNRLNPHKGCLMIDCHTSLKRARLTRKETGTHITVQRSSDTDNAAVDLSSMEHSIASLNSALVPLQYFELVPWGRHSAAVTGTLQKIVEDFRKANGGPGDLRCEIVHVELVPQTWRQTRRRPEEDKAKNKAGDKRALVAVAAVLEADQKKTKQVTKGLWLPWQLEGEDTCSGEHVA